MTALPDIPAAVHRAGRDSGRTAVCAGTRRPALPSQCTGRHRCMWAIVLAVFLHLTGHVPLACWVPCMVTAIAAMYLYLWAAGDEPAGGRLQLRPGVYSGRAGRQRGVAAALLALAARGPWYRCRCCCWRLVYWTLYGLLAICSTAVPARAADITAARHADGGRYGDDRLCCEQPELFADEQATMSIYYIRTLVDFSGVLILTVQHEQLRENGAAQRACRHGRRVAPPV